MIKAHSPTDKHRLFSRKILSTLCKRGVRVVSALVMGISILAPTLVVFKEEIKPITANAEYEIDLSNVKKDTALSAEEVNEKIEKYKKKAEDDGYGDVMEELIEEDPLTWRQADPRWGSDFLLPGYMSNGTGHDNVLNSGCKTISSCVLLKLSGTAGKDFNPIVYCEFFNDTSNTWNVDGAEGTAWNNNGILYEDNISLWNGDFQHVCKVDKSSFSSEEEFFESLRSAMDAGLYVQPEVNTSCGHYVAAVDYDDKGIIYCDVGFVEEGNELTIYAEESKHWNTVMYYRVYWCSKPFQKGKCNDSDEATDEEANLSYDGLTSWLDEFDIIDRVYLQEDPLEFSAREDCSLIEVMEIESWKDNIANNSEGKIYKYIRRVIMFLGILLIVYSTLLFVGYQFDRVNNVIDIQLLSVLTLGRLEKAPDADSGTFTPENPNTRLVTFRDICGVSLAGIGIGVLLLSGKVFTLLSGGMHFIDNLFD